MLDSFRVRSTRPTTNGATPVLPVDAYLDEIRALLERHRALVLSAAPGAGKTTRVPPALLDAGPLILLQPRRVAARAIARRIAEERGWRLGGDVGWQVRFERRFTRDTRLLVVTEGILTARLQQDPLLSEFATIVLDEFHERSIHADVGLALARQAWLARDDLRILVMSATLDVRRASDYLGDCPVVDVPGARHPLVAEYAPGETVAAAVRDLLPRTAGQVLCFLPGAREIERAAADLAGAGGALDVVALHGALSADAQDEALRDVPRRRVILATNIAETSLTVPGVAVVVDSGQVKVARYDTSRAVDSLTVERVTQDSADQRAGRAARLGPGLVRRLWDERDRLRAHREPEIARVDLAGALLNLISWGADPSRFEWFEMPPAERIEAALRLLRRLGAVGPGDPPTLTPVGRQLQRFPLHPRLARILLDGRGSVEAAAACAAEGVGVAAELRRVAARVLGEDAREHIGDDELRHALFTGYADRLARRRPASADRYLLASGHGAVLARDAAADAGEFLVALDVTAAQRDGIGEARIRAASRVERAWIAPTAVDVEHHLDRDSGTVRARRIARYDAIVLSETPMAPDPGEKARLMRAAWTPPERLLRRIAFAGVSVDLETALHQAAAAAERLDEIDVLAYLPYETRRTLAEQAPETLVVPSGRAMRLEYDEEGAVACSVKLQELFGLAASPALGPRRVPVTFHLLAPNGRPVQTTRDLRSFWERTYPEVRRELRGRYPKHPWPDDPWNAPPTHRTIRRA